MATTPISRPPSNPANRTSGDKIGLKYAKSLRYDKDASDLEKDRLVLQKIGSIIQEVIQDEKGPVYSLRRKQPIQWITNSISKVLEDKGLDEQSENVSGILEVIQTLSDDDEDIKDKLQDVLQKIQDQQDEDGVESIKSKLKSFLSTNNQMSVDVSSIVDQANELGLKTSNIEKLTTYINKVNRQIKLTTLDISIQQQSGLKKWITSIKKLKAQINDKYQSFNETIAGKIISGITNFIIIKPLKWIGTKLVNIGKSVINKIASSIKDTYQDLKKGFWGIVFKAIITPPGMFFLGFVFGFFWYRFLKPAFDWIYENIGRILNALGIAAGVGLGAKAVSTAKTIGRFFKWLFGRGKPGERKPGRGKPGGRKPGSGEQEKGIKPSEIDRAKQAEYDANKRLKDAQGARQELKTKYDNAIKQNKLYKSQIENYQSTIADKKLALKKAQVEGKFEKAEKLTEDIEKLSSKIENLGNTMKKNSSFLKGVDKDFKQINETVAKFTKEYNEAAKTVTKLEEAAKLAKEATKGAESIAKGAESISKATESITKGAESIAKGAESITKGAESTTRTIQSVSDTTKAMSIGGKAMKVGGVALGGLVTGMSLYSFGENVYDMTQNGFTVDNTLGASADLGIASFATAETAVGLGLVSGTGVVATAAALAPVLWVGLLATTAVSCIFVELTNREQYRSKVEQYAHSAYRKNIAKINNVLKEYEGSARIEFIYNNRYEIAKYLKQIRKEYVDGIKNFKKLCNNQLKEGKAFKPWMIRTFLSVVRKYIGLELHYCHQVYGDVIKDSSLFEVPKLSREDLQFEIESYKRGRYKVLKDWGNYKKGDIVDDDHRFLEYVKYHDERAFKESFQLVGEKSSETMLFSDEMEKEDKAEMEKLAGVRTWMEVGPYKGYYKKLIDLRKRIDGYTTLPDYIKKPQWEKDYETEQLIKEYSKLREELDEKIEQEKAKQKEEYEKQLGEETKKTRLGSATYTVACSNGQKLSQIYELLTQTGPVTDTQPA